MIATINPAEARRLLIERKALLIDVREPDEHSKERIEGGGLMPLGSIASASLPPADGRMVIVHCQAGRRSREAVARLRGRGINAVSLDGGIDAWKAAGLPVLTASARMPIPIMRQVQVAVGVLLLAGSAAAWWVSPLFIAVPALLGAGLLFAGVSGTCGLAVMLSVMPWNAPLRAARPAGACDAKS